MDESREPILDAIHRLEGPVMMPSRLSGGADAEFDENQPCSSMEE